MWVWVCGEWGSVVGWVVWFVVGVLWCVSVRDSHSSLLLWLTLCCLTRFNKERDERREREGESSTQPHAFTYARNNRKIATQPNNLK